MGIGGNVAQEVTQDDEKWIHDQRKDLDRIDESIIELLELRMKKAYKVVKRKRVLGIEAKDEIRQGEILYRLMSMETRLIPDSLVTAVWCAIFDNVLSLAAEDEGA